MCARARRRLHSDPRLRARERDDDDDSMSSSTDVESASRRRSDPGSSGGTASSRTTTVKMPGRIVAVDFGVDSARIRRTDDAGATTRGCVERGIVPSAVSRRGERGGVGERDSGDDGGVGRGGRLYRRRRFVVGYRRRRRRWSENVREELEIDARDERGESVRV
jgi:hypothetical protein